MCAQALELELPGAGKGESQELCFVPTGRYDEFVSQRAPERLRPGRIVDEAGRTLGSHAGIHRFTLGQRKNLGVATGQRAYVVGMDAESHDVQLGPRERLLASGARVAEATLAPDVRLPLRCEVAVRYRGTPVSAHVLRSGERGLELRFAEPVLAVVPGQYAVLYRDQRVLGGGAIEAALPCASAAVRAEASL